MRERFGRRVVGPAWGRGSLGLVLFTLRFEAGLETSSTSSSGPSGSSLLPHVRPPFDAPLLAPSPVLPSVIPSSPSLLSVPFVVFCRPLISFLFPLFPSLSLSSLFLPTCSEAPLARRRADQSVIDLDERGLGLGPYPLPLCDLIANSKERGRNTTLQTA